MSEIRIEQLTKQFPGGVTAVDGVDVVVKDGEFVTLLGPSGCGKTTTLRCVAGLERPTGGRIRVGETLLNDGPRMLVPPERRSIGMIFQSYAVWPHMTVFHNVGYGPKIQGRAAAAVTRIVSDALALVQMADYKDRYPSQLSGGQQQRVALARAVALHPEVLLFDEPLSNLDAKLRAEMRVELRQLQQSMGTTAVYVTHDQEEAMAISDRILVMNQGRIVQDGSPWEVYANPRTRFVAGFVGEINFLAGTVETVTAEGALVVGPGGSQFRTARRDGLVPGSATTLGIRPQHFHLLPGDEADDRPNCWRGRIERRLFMGKYVDLRVRMGESLLQVEVPPEDLAGLADAAEVVLTTQPRHVLTMKE